MAYQFLQHDGFVYRRPRPRDHFKIKGIEIWDGTKWKPAPSVDIAMQPVFYGSEVTEDEAKKVSGGTW